ncbi:MAG: hypothetical protein N2315_05000 [Thermanaerothrix sp.]|nr:hypothetical protein [Thermanaerothrix sp.]
MAFNGDKIEELLERLYEASDEEEIQRAAKALLKEDPSNPAAKVALWTLKDEEEALRSIGDLREALAETVRRLGGEEPKGLYDERTLVQTYGEALMHLSSASHALGRFDDAEAYARKLMEFDADEEIFPARLLLYRALLDKKDFSSILETYDQDSLDSPAGAHGRAIALIEKDAPEGEIWEAVLDAFSLSPDLPFVILGLEALPDEDEDEDFQYDQIFHEAAYLEGPWTESDDRLFYLYLPALVIGRLTGRLDEDETEELDEMLNHLPKEKSDLIRNLLTYGGPRPDEPSELDQWAIGKLMEILGD